MMKIKREVTRRTILTSYCFFLGNFLILSVGELALSIFLEPQLSLNCIDVLDAP